MLLFNAYSPVGHAIHVCSMTTFVIGDEDVVLPNFEPVNISGCKGFNSILLFIYLASLLPIK